LNTVLEQLAEICYERGEKEYYSTGKLAISNKWITEANAIRAEFKKAKELGI